MLVSRSAADPVACASDHPADASFHVTLCVCAERTADGLPLRVTGPHSVAVGTATLEADEVVSPALPSRIASSVLGGLTAAPPLSTTACVLFSSSPDLLRLGDCVVEAVLLRACQSGAGLPEELTASARGADGCLTCERLRPSPQSDAASVAEAVRDALGALSDVGAATLRLPDRGLSLSVASRLEAAHLSALALASQRRLLVYLDDTITAPDALLLWAEVAAVRGHVGRLAAWAPPPPTAPEGDSDALLLRLERALAAQAAAEEERDAASTALDEREAEHHRRLAEERRRAEELKEQLRVVEAELTEARAVAEAAATVKTEDGAPRGSALLAVSPARLMELELRQEANERAVLDFQRREGEWQRALAEAQREARRARKEAAAMEQTISLQARTISEAKRYIAASSHSSARPSRSTSATETTAGTTDDTFHLRPHALYH